jgi:hypothetical protein
MSKKMQLYTVYFIWKLFYMFRVVPHVTCNYRQRVKNTQIYQIFNNFSNFKF